MLRSLCQPSFRHSLGELLAQPSAAGLVAEHAPVAQLTCLRLFTVSPPMAAGDDTPGDAKQATDAHQSAEAPASGAKTPDMLQNAKLWRQWVDGRLDDRHRSALRSQPSPPYNQAMVKGASRSGPGAQQGSQPHHRPKDPSKDWKHASRSLRSSQDRIASILVPDADGTPNAEFAGKYGFLGTASDAPRVVAGASAKAEEISPRRIHPHRLFYPGATYTPEELDPYKAKEVFLRSDLAVNRGSIPARAVEALSDFRNPAFLRNFVSDAGKLQPRRKTRLPAKVHRELARQVKLARALGLMSPTSKLQAGDS